MNIEHSVITKLEEAINLRYHAMERFYDIDAAKDDREKNLKMVERLKDGTFSREDEESMNDLIRAPY